MKNFIFPLLLSALLLFLVVFALTLVSHPANDYDEGVYLTTYKLVDAGYPIYKSTYFSQFPGFFITTYPLYKFFGSSLEAGRLGVYFWAVLGIAGIIFLGRKIRSGYFTIVAILSLFSLNIFRQQILTFHPDAIVSAFSLASLLAFLVFKERRNILFLILSAFFVSVSILVKLDLTILPAIIFQAVILSRGKHNVNLFKLLSVYIFTIIVVVLGASFPFGLKDIIDDPIRLRMHAFNYPSNPFAFFTYILNEPLLLALILSAFIFSFINFKKKVGDIYLNTTLNIWLMTTIIVLTFYHPLMPHHLVLLALPSALVFSYSFSNFFNPRDFPGVRKIVPAAIGLAIVLSLVFPFMRPHGFMDIAVNERVGIDIIKLNTRPSDSVVSDNGLLNGLSGRLPPPQLSDTSSVRILSGDLRPEEFESIIRKDTPRMIMAWSDRLARIEGFENIVRRSGYELIYFQEISGNKYFAYKIAER